LWREEGIWGTQGDTKHAKLSRVRLSGTLSGKKGTSGEGTGPKGAQFTRERAGRKELVGLNQGTIRRKSP